MILKNFKHLVSVGVISLLSCFIILSCNNFTGLTIDGTEKGGSSYSKEEIERLQKIEAKYNFVQRMDRAAEGEERNKLIEEMEPEMIAALHEEFGDEAVKFYGTSEAAVKDSSRALTISSPSYKVDVTASATEHWGAWWDYFTVSVSCYTIIATNRFDYRPDLSGYYHYTDPITNVSHLEDYTYYNSAEYLRTKPSAGNNSFSSGAALVWEIEDQIKRANQGRFEIEGEHKNGWFPKLGWCEIDVAFRATEFNGRVLSSAWRFKSTR